MILNSRLKYSCLILAILTISFLSRSSHASQPNILVIFVDDMGYNDLSIQEDLNGFQVNGDNVIKTPNIDSIGEDGILFTAGYVTAPQCVPSRAGIVTGRYQQKFGMELNAATNPDFGIDPNIRTMPDFLEPHGYTTAHLGKWHLGSASTDSLPSDKGFDWGGLGNDPAALSAVEARLANERGEPGFTFSTAMNWSVSTKRTLFITEGAKWFIDQNKDNPFFIYLCYNVPHKDYLSTVPYFDQNGHIADGSKRTYAGMISEMDDAIGDLMAKLDEHGLTEDTLIFYISDNGAQQATDSPHTVDSNYPLLGKKGSLFGGGIRIPYMVKWPGQIPAGHVSDEPVSSLDVIPTSLAAAGAIPENQFIPPADTQLEGMNMLSYFKNPTGVTPPERALFFRWSGQMAIRRGQWKLVNGAFSTAPPASESFQLFDLDADNSETTDLTSQYPDIADQLKDELMAWNDECVAPRWTNKTQELNNLYGTLGMKSYVLLDSNGSVPATPSGFQVSLVNDSTVDFTWQTVGYANAYLLEESQNGTDGWKKVITTDQSVSSVRLEGIDNSQTNYYRIRATNGAGYSNYSDPVRLSGPGTPPSNFKIEDDLDFSSPGILVTEDNTQTIRTSSTGNQWGGYNAGTGAISVMDGSLVMEASANQPDSYVFSLLSGDVSSINLSDLAATIKIQTTSASSNQKLRWLIRDEVGNWFISDETWDPALPIHAEERYFTAYPTSRATWNQIDNPSVLNQPGNTAVGLLIGSAADPDLTSITGYGFWVSRSAGDSPLVVTGMQLHEYEALVYYHPGKASHWFYGPDNLRVGMSDLNGACFNEMYWNTSKNAIAAMNGRQCQYAFRSGYHSGKWNPTQAGHDEYYGLPIPIQTTGSSVGTGIRYEYGPGPLANWHGDGQLDIAENEDLTNGLPYNERAGWENRAFKDDDNLDESQLSQAVEVISDFEQGGFVEDVSSVTDETVLVLHFNLYQDFVRLGHNTLQFNENAIAFDRDRTPESAYSIIKPGQSVTDLSPILPGNQTSTTTDMTSIPYRWADRLDVLEANFQYLWNYDAGSQSWTVYDLVTESGTVPPPDGALISIVADSPNPADAATCQAVGLYFPLWSEINQFSVAGIDRESGEIVYQEDRLDSLNGRAYQTTKGGWKGPEADISSEFTKRTIEANYAGILSPDHTPEGTFERLRQEFFWIFGSPQSLVESLPDLDSYFIPRQPVMPGKAHLRLMPGQSGLADGSVDIPTNQGLSWLPAIRATSYNVYLGLSEAAVVNADEGSPSFIGSSQTNSFSPSNLVSNTTYFWRVDSVNDSGISKGDVWRFATTEAVVYPLETELTFNLGAGVTTSISGQASAVHVKDNVLIGTGSHQVTLTMTGYDPDGLANFRSVPAGVTANGIAVVTGSNNSDIGIGQGLKFDLKMLRGGIPVQNEVRFQITDFTIMGRLDNFQRDYSIISSEGEFIETNFDPNDIPVNVPEGSFSPGVGEDFSWNRVGSGGAIVSLETIILKLVFVPDPTETSRGTPYSYLNQYFPGLVDNADYETADLTDPDKDGTLTWKEFHAGTNPIDPNSVLSITSASILNADTLSLTWSSVPGKTYSVLMNTTLEGDEWSLIQSSILATEDYTEKTISIDSHPVFLSVQVDY